MDNKEKYEKAMAAFNALPNEKRRQIIRRIIWIGSIIIIAMGIFGYKYAVRWSADSVKDPFHVLTWERYEYSEYNFEYPSNYATIRFKECGAIAINDKNPNGVTISDNKGLLITASGTNLLKICHLEGNYRDFAAFFERLKSLEKTDIVIDNHQALRFGSDTDPITYLINVSENKTLFIHFSNLPGGGRHSGSPLTKAMFDRILNSIQFR